MKITRLCVLASLLCALAIGMQGCGGPSGPPTSVVSGTVKLNGQPLEEGTITFIPSDGKGGAGSAKIEDGKYSGTIELGPKEVRIQSPKKTGERKAYDTPDSPMIPIFEEQVPLRYNAQSELKLDVKAGKTTGDFNLESAAKQ